jgi:hypothetical protein
MRRPTLLEPVNDTMAMSGSVQIASPASAPPGSTCSTPFGRPASSNIRAMMNPPVMAVRGSGLSTTALPVASAGATARIERISGKLNGEMMPMTPRGMRRAMLMRPGLDGSTRPCGSVHIAAER